MIAVDEEHKVRVTAPEAVENHDDERERIVDALEACGGSQTKAAVLLGVSLRTVVSRVKEYNIPRPRDAGAVVAVDAGGSERDRVKATLEACGGNQTKAASALNIDRYMLGALLEEYGIARPRV